MARSIALTDAIAALNRHYRPVPASPPSTDPFELVLFENVAYLASPEKRREAFELLRATIGTEPGAILAAPRDALERVTAKGIMKGTSAEKLRECAAIAMDKFDGVLDEVVRRPLPAAKKALQSFPGIGEPGAEKILLFAGRHALLAPDSNALRVLVRLGIVSEGKSYARTYAAGREAARDLPQTVRAMQEAHLVLQHHGRTLCKHSAPRCGACPLVQDCAYARAQR